MFALLSTLVLSAPFQKWSPPYQTVSTPAGYESSARSMAPGEAKILLQGDRMTFLAKGAENTLLLPDWFELKFRHDEGADVWVAQATMKGWDRSFFGYGVKKGAETTRGTFIGRHAPKLPARVKLTGSLLTVAFDSKELGEVRNLMIYLPPNAGPNLKAVYMADGQSCKEFAQVLEPLILAKKIDPTAIVGLFHGEFKGDVAHYEVAQDFRAREYLKVADPNRFEAHLRFVTQEVIPWAEGKFGLASGAANRAVFGFSNGGAFALVASAERPDIFGAALPMSVAVFDPAELRKTVAGKPLPRYFLTSGTLEPFIKATKLTEEILKAAKAKAKVRRSEFVSGHDEAMWRLGFAETLPKVFPYRG